MLRFDPPDLFPQVDSYAAVEMQPLRVTAYLSAPVYAPDAPMLDGILAAAVVREVYQGSIIPDVPAGASPAVPVPLQVLWRDDLGFPLHACTPFLPVGMAFSDVIYHHKRHQPGRFTQRTKTGLPFSVKSTDGRYMDRQRPLTTTVTEALTCTAVGNLKEVARLLEEVTHIGKERSRGLGGIKTWCVEPAQRFDLVDEGFLTRNVPVVAAEALGLNISGQGAALGAWTPPHWQNGLYSLVYPAGTQVGSL